VDSDIYSKYFCAVCQALKRTAQNIARSRGAAEKFYAKKIRTLAARAHIMLVRISDFRGDKRNAQGNTLRQMLRRRSGFEGSALRRTTPNAAARIRLIGPPAYRCPTRRFAVRFGFVRAETVSIGGRRVRSVGRLGGRLCGRKARRERAVSAQAPAFKPQNTENP